MLLMRKGRGEDPERRGEGGGGYLTSLCRAINKVLGLAGQAEILIGHLYNLIQSWSHFLVAIVENCTENGQWPAATLSSAVRTH